MLSFGLRKKTSIRRCLSGFFPDLAAAGVIRTAGVTGQLCQRPQLLGNESVDLFLIIADLEVALIQNDRPFQNRWIFLNKMNQLAEGHLIQINRILLDDLGPFGNNILRSIFTAHQQMPDLRFIEQCCKNIFFKIRQIPLFQPLFDLTAGSTAR